MIAGIGNGVMKPSDGSDMFIAVAVIAPAAVLLAILANHRPRIQNMACSQMCFGVPAVAIVHQLLCSNQSRDQQR
jgi:hypothetical protein